MDRYNAYLHLIEKAKYTIVNITPVPQHVKGGIFSAPMVQTNMLAIDYDGQRYFEMTATDFKQLQRMSSEEYFCSPTVIHDLNASPNCMIDAIYNRSTVFSCEVHTFTVKELLWKHLLKPNTWMFLAPNPIRVSLRCNEHLEDIWLNNTGVIHVHQACTIDTGKTQLKTKTLATTLGVSTFHKPLVYNFTNKHGSVVNKSYDDNHIYQAHENFAGILHDETLLQDDIDTTLWESIKPHVTGSSIGTISTILIILLIFVIIYIIRRMNINSSPTFVLPAAQDIQPRVNSV